MWTGDALIEDPSRIERGFLETMQSAQLDDDIIKYIYIYIYRGDMDERDKMKLKQR